MLLWHSDRSKKQSSSDLLAKWSSVILFLPNVFKVATSIKSNHKEEEGFVCLLPCGLAHPPLQTLPALALKHPVCRPSHQGQGSLRASSWRPSEVHLLSAWTACFPFLPLISCPASSPSVLPASSLVWSAVTLLDAGLRGGGSRLMAAEERVCDTQAWDQHRKSSYLAPSIIPAP